MPVVSDYTALLSGSYWNGIEVTGRPVIVTFSFPTSAPAYDASVAGFTAATVTSFQAFTATEQTQDRSALTEWSAASGLIFVEVAPGQGDLNFQLVDFNTTSGPSYAGAGGIAFYPFGDWNYFSYPSYSGDLDSSGDVFMNTQLATGGSVNYGTLLHEIGHAIGLKHPTETFTNFAALSPVVHDQVLSSDDATRTIMAQGAGTGVLKQLDKDAAAFVYGGAGTGGVYTASAAGSTSVSTWSWNATTQIMTQTGFAGDDTIRGTSVKDVINGSGGNDRLFGLAGADTLNGGDGNDSLFSGTGTDTLVGGKGDDNYYVEATSDVVTEVNGEGYDSVYSNKTFTLSNNVEYLQLFGENLTGTGNSLANTIFGDGTFKNTLNGASGNDYIVAGSGADILSGGNDDDSLYGVGGNDTLRGDAGTDFLSGGTGLDKLDGGTGADSMYGGADNDTYTVDNVGDQVHEDTTPGIDDGGIDLVNASASFSLSAFVENLTLTGTAAIDGTGNSLDNKINGNTAANVLRGGDGNDTLTGKAGADTLYGEVGNDILSGGIENDTLYGGVGVDRLDGGTGADTLYGGADNDTYTVDDAGDQVREDSAPGVDDGGVDLVNASVSFTLGAFVENLTLTGSAAIDGTGNGLDNKIIGNTAANVLHGGNGKDTLTGNAGADTLYGEIGDDTLSGGTEVDSLYGGAGLDKLDGGAGADIMYGGADNDTYTVDSAGDQVREDTTAGIDDGGVDLVNASVTFTLGAFVENLTLTGTAAIDGTGNSLDNKITGNAFANVLRGNDGNDTLSGGGGIDTLYGGIGSDKIDGGTGADIMYGGTDNDTYTVDDSSDQVIEAFNEGTLDLVNASASFTLGDNVEKLTLTGTGNINGTGNVLANTITGNVGNNVLSGGGGNDVLSGGDGNDTLEGGSALDKLTGGLGADTFIFDAPTGTSVDSVVDFLSSQGDRLAVHAADYGLAVGGLPDASYFALSGAADAGHARFIYTEATRTLSWDADGVSSTTNAAIATFGAGTALTYHDFVVL